MSTERFRMASGRIATLDTNQPAPAVEEARRMLLASGAVRINEETPAGQGEGSESTLVPSEEKNVNDIIIPETADIRESVRMWATQHAAQAEQAARVAVNDPDFQKWAEEQIRRRPDLSIDKCARRWVDEHGLVSVPWPASVTPSGWNVDIGSDLGGEVSVSVDYEIEDPEVGTVGAALGVLIAVVVDVDPTRTLPEPGIEVGDYFVSLPTISHWGVENTSDADADRLAALSRVLLRAAEALPAAAKFSRLLGGSERSLEIPVAGLNEVAS